MSIIIHNKAANSLNSLYLIIINGLKQRPLSHHCLCVHAYIVDTLVSTIGLPPLQNGRRHFSSLILHLE